MRIQPVHPLFPLDHKMPVRTFGAPVATNKHHDHGDVYIRAGGPRLYASNGPVSIAPQSIRTPSLPPSIRRPARVSSVPPPLTEAETRDVESRLDALTSKLGRSELLTVEEARELGAIAQYYQRKALSDELTGLGNRLDWANKAKGYAVASTSEVSPTSLDHTRFEGQTVVLAVDIDHFKRVNDTYGHDVGDQVIQVLAQVLKGKFSKRGGDAFRMGGEEFILILKDAGYEGASTVAGRILEIVRNLTIQIPDPSNGGELTVRFTVSIGYAAITTTVEDALKQADQALYRAKNRGRNKAVSAEVA